MRIRTLFLIGFVAAAVPGFIGSAWRATTAWQEWRQGITATMAAQVVGDGMRAQTAAGVETGHLSAALVAANPDIATLRQAAQTLDQCMESLTRSAAAYGADTGVLTAALDRLKVLRRQVEQAAQQPPPTRDAALTREVLAQRANLTEMLIGFVTEAGRKVTMVAPKLATMIQISAQAMDLRDYAGRRSIGMNGWVNGQSPTAESVRNAHILTGRIEQAWASIQRMSETTGSARLAEAQARLTSGFFRETEPRYREIAKIAEARLAAGADAAAPAWPYNLAELRAFAVPAMVTLLPMRDAALEEALALGEAAQSSSRTSLLLALGLAAVSLCVVVGGARLLLRRLVVPVQALTGTVGRIAGGELDLVVPDQDRRDEIGSMAQAVETLRQASLERVTMAAAQAREQEEKAARAQRLDALVREFEGTAATMLQAVAGAAGRLDATAAEMSGTARDGIERAATVAAATGEASGNVQTVAAATEKLAASIAEVVRQMQGSATVTRQAAEAAGATDQTVRGLSEAANRIGDVVKLISDIANQTNLLALNATIEAARAGEAGKGFAVVANEVKQLASQTGKATEEIGTQITAMQAETRRTVEAIAAIARTIAELDSRTAQVAATAAEQAAATREIGHAVSAASGCTENASRQAAGVKEGAERTGMAAGELRTASGDLARQADDLRQQVDRFLGGLRAA